MLREALPILKTNVLAASSCLTAGIAYNLVMNTQAHDLVSISVTGVSGGLALSFGVSALRTGAESIARVFKEKNFRAKGSGLFKARWATTKEMRRAGMFKPIGRPLGIAFDGRAIFEPVNLKPVHGKTLAITGSGKTTAGALPALMHYALSPDRPTVVVMDLKDGELANQCVPVLRKYGIRCVVIDRSRCTSFETDSLNPFAGLIAEVKAGSSEAGTTARAIALTKIPEPPEDSRNKYFRDGPRELITFVVLVLATISPQDCTPNGVWEVLAIPHLFQGLLKHTDGYSSALIAQAERILQRQKSNSDHAGDFLNSARQAFEIYETGSKLEKVGENATYDYSEVTKGNQVVFIVGSQRTVDVLEPYYVLHLRGFSQAIKNKRGKTVHLLLEELTNTPLRSLVSELTVFRAYGGRALMISQQESEIIRRFGPELAKTLDGQAAVKQVFGVSRYEDADLVSRALGKATGVAEVVSDKSRTMNDQGRPLMTPEEILSMPNDQQLIFCTGMYPIRCRKLYQNEIAPWGGELAPNPLEGGKKLPYRPKVRIKYGKPE
jgi:type IV secretion system protein VirD4